jgi:hypothetical protein
MDLPSGQKRSTISINYEVSAEGVDKLKSYHCDGSGVFLYLPSLPSENIVQLS